MPEPIRVRCSSLSIATACGQSMRGPHAAKANYAGGSVGTAVHQVLTGNAIPAGWHLDPDARGVASLMESAIRTAASEAHVADALDEIRRLAWNSLRGMHSIAEFFPDPICEPEQDYQADGVLLTGHTDVLAYEPELADVRVLDFKSGRIDAEHEPQLRGYAWLGLQAFPEAQSVSAATILVRHHPPIVDWYKWTRGEMEDWWHWLCRRLRDQEYHPGRHCGFCPRGHACEAKTAMLAQAVKFLLDPPLEIGQPVLKLPDDLAERSKTILDLYDRVKLVERAISVLKEIIRAQVVAEGGTVQHDGRELRVVPKKTTTIRFSEAFELIASLVAPSSFDDVFSVSKTELERAVKATVGKGMKGKHWLQVLDDLERIGAIETTPGERLEAGKASLLAIPGPCNRGE